MPEIMNETRERKDRTNAQMKARKEREKRELALLAGLPSELLNAAAQSALEYMQVLSRNLCIVSSTKENSFGPDVC